MHAVGVLCMRRVRLFFSPLHERGVDATGGASFGASRGGTLRSPRLASCAVAAGSIHHNLTFNWRGLGQREKEATVGEKEKKKAMEADRRAGSVSTPGWWIYCGVISLFLEVDDGCEPQCLCWKVCFNWGRCTGKMPNDLMCTASAPNLTPKASMMGICMGLSKVRRHNLIWNSLAVSQGQPRHTASVRLSRARCIRSLRL